MPNNKEEDEDQSTLDVLLMQIGDFGKYQTYVLILVSIVLILHSAVHIIFVFSAIELDYRCKVPICDDNNNTVYQEDWIDNAIPLHNKLPSKCERYRMINENKPNPCTISNFNRSIIESCNEYVYKHEEITILNDYNLQCEDNLWKMTLVGTINNVGQFFGMTIYGIISDRYGRKAVLILGMFLCGLSGVAQAFAPDYLWFVSLEFLGAFFGAGTYICAFIIGVELVGPGKRVLVGSIISCLYPVGEILTAAIAWCFKSFRPTIFALYVPTLAFPFLFFCLPDSIRWLLTEGRVDEAKKILRKAAKVNGRRITENTLDKIKVQDENQIEKIPLRKMLKSSILITRIVNCCISWITCTFLFYGLSLNSVALSDDIYLNFILTALVEVPGYCCVYFILKKIGRRICLALSFILCAICCFALIFIDSKLTNVLITINLIGKFGSTIAFTVCYIITSEIFPTSLRHSLMGTCSMFGRIGSMLAPQIPLLVQAWTPLPLVLFGATATTAGLLSLHFPETFNVKLPDTIEEAERIGKSSESLPLK